MKTNPKKTALVVAIVFAACSLTQAQSWDVNLNNFLPTETAKLGTQSNHSLNFFTAGSNKMTLQTNGDLEVSGAVKATNGILFNDDFGIYQGTFSDPSNVNYSYIAMGINIGSNPNVIIPCTSIPNTTWSAFGGGYLSTATVSGGNIGKIRMFANSSTGNAHIEADGTNSSGSSTALFLNTLCGRNTYINTGTSGGSIFMGDFVNAKKHVEIGDPSSPITTANNIALDINTNAGTGVRLRTTTDAMELISVSNTNATYSGKPFIVYGDGKTEIATENPDALIIQDPYSTAQPGFSFHNYGQAEIFNLYTSNYLSMNNANNNVQNFLFNTNGVLNIKSTVANATDIVFDIKDGSNNRNFQVKRNGRTIIGLHTATNHPTAMLTVEGKAVAQEVVVTQINWADFVFDKDYKLMPLSEVENFYKKEKHLPDVPTTADISENGNDLGKTDALLLQKIEELTLYVVEQQKQIDKLKAQIEENK